MLHLPASVYCHISESVSISGSGFRNGTVWRNIGDLFLVAEFRSPPKVYTFSFIVGNIIPKSVKCIHSATKYC